MFLHPNPASVQISFGWFRERMQFVYLSCNNRKKKVLDLNKVLWTFSEWKRSTKEGNLSKTSFIIRLWDLACLKKECFRSLCADGLLDGSFNKHIAITCLKYYKKKGVGQDFSTIAGAQLYTGTNKMVWDLVIVR